MTIGMVAIEVSATASGTTNRGPSLVYYRFLVYQI